MQLKVDVNVNPIALEEEDGDLVELAKPARSALAPEDEDRYPFVRPSSAAADLAQN